jgi:glycosyltransferase involved in cell wall biosynthesis
METESKNNTYVSIIVPSYNEEKNIPLLYIKLKKVLDSLKKEYEVLFIDDGSKDNTVNEIIKLNKKDKRVKLIQFQRNFGKAAALSAGFIEASGTIVFTMDADLQDDPKEIPKFIEKINQGYDMVSGWKYIRKDPVTKTLPSKFFNWLTSITTGVKVHDSNCGFKAYRNEVVKNISVYGELHRYIPAIAHWKGYKVGEVKVEHHARKFGKSKYGVERLMKGFFDLITVKFLTRYAKKPLHLFGLLGFLCFLVGFIAGIYLVVGWFRGIAIGNRPLLMLCVLFIVTGIQLISIGLLGEMINSSNRKDDYVIKKKY